jgi:hypothetical protein
MTLSEISGLLSELLGDFRVFLGAARRFPGYSRSCSEISGSLSELLGDFRVTLGAARRFPGYSRSCSGILGAAREFSELLGNSRSCSEISGLFSELLGIFLGMPRSASGCLDLPQDVPRQSDDDDDGIAGAEARMAVAVMQQLG